MKSKIVPSIIAKNQKEFDKVFSKVSKVSKTLHLDVMDSEFVKNHSLDFDLELPREFKYEVHLMVEEPFKFIEDNLSKIKIVFVHIESANSKNIIKIINYVHKHKKKIGLVLNPETSLEKVKHYLGKIDRVLLMTVQPGKYGAKFEPKVLKKISELRKILDKKNLKIDIQVDGSVNDKTILGLKTAGANIFVVGSYLEKSRDIKKSYSELISKL